MVTLIPTAKPGWTFSGWTGVDSGDISTPAPYTITMDEDKAVTATFTQDEYTLTVNILPAAALTAGCAVDRSGATAPYNYGDVVILTSNAAAGWTFDHWAGDLTGSTDPDNVTMNGDRAVTAVFTEDCYDLDITIDPVGSGSVAKDPLEECYTYGTEVELTATAADGWTFSHWEGHLTGSTNPDTVIMNGDRAVTAVFEEAIISPENSTMTFDLGQKRIRLALEDQNGNKIPGSTLDLSLNMWEVWQGTVERTITEINFGTMGANWDVEIFVTDPTANPKPTVKYYGYDASDPVIISWK